jgi:hypothetical protein
VSTGPDDDRRELARQAAELAALTELPAGAPTTAPTDRQAVASVGRAALDPATAPTAHAGAVAHVPTEGAVATTPAPPEPPGGTAAEARQLASFTATLSRSARSAGVAAVANGHWLAETVVELASHLPLRDKATLEEHHDGLSGAPLAAALVRIASRSAAAVGAASGALMSVEEWLPLGWVAVPFELLAETAAIAAIEMKLIGELHELYGGSVPGSGLERGYALARAWAERRGVGSAVLTEGVPALGDAIGRTTRKELLRLIRRRTVRRTGLNLFSLGPMMVGGAAGATLNRRSTRRLGDAVIDSLT